VTEAKLQRSLIVNFEQHLDQCVVLSHSDQYIKGIPDLSVTWWGMTTWLELKFLNPSLIASGVQHLMMCNLERAGSAYYVLYDSRSISTRIVKPYTNECVSEESGYAHRSVVDFIRRLHSDDHVR
jgi:hypothetical protein